MAMSQFSQYAPPMPSSRSLVAHQTLVAAPFIGGYNFAWAISTGHAAGLGAAR